MRSIHKTHRASRRLLLASLAAFAVLGSAAVTPPATADTSQNVISSVIPRGSDWSYYRGSDAPPASWQTEASSWKSGTAPFGIGSKTGQSATKLTTDGTMPRSVYFTKTFTMTSDVPEWSWVNTWADDGIVVWINGVEVGRKNAPEGELTAKSYATAAPSSTEARNNPVSFTVPVALFHEGENTMAVQVLGNGRATPNLSFDAHLVREDTPAPVTVSQSKLASAPVRVQEAAPAQPEATGTCGAQGSLAPACGALWGVYSTSGGSLTSAVTDLEAKVGRTFDITMRYHDFSSDPPGVFPDAAEKELGSDRTLLFAWQARVSRTDSNISWSRIIKGEMDSFIDAAAGRIKAYGKPVMMAFDPEFDNGPNETKGSMQEYASAYRHIHDRFAAKGVSNVIWAWVSTGYLGAGNDTRIMNGYPGDAYVDWVGYDPYNFYTCNGTDWATFEEKIAAKYDFFIEQGLGDKPQLLSEYGTSYDAANPEQATDWHRDIPDALKQYPNVKALVRFNSGGALGTGKACQLQIENGPGMLSSFKDAGLDPYVNTRAN